MKAIVVYQPHAALTALGIKTIETRPAPPNGPMRPAGIRGLPGLAVEPGERIAIVAGASKPKPNDIRPMLDLWMASTGESWFKAMVRIGGDSFDSGALPRGAVVCTVTVPDALRITAPGVRRRGDHAILANVPHEGDLPHQRGGLWAIGITPAFPRNPNHLPAQLPLGDFTVGRWGWLLTDVELCDPIPCKGKQGVFRLPDDVAERVSP